MLHFHKLTFSGSLETWRTKAPSPTSPQPSQEKGVLFLDLEFYKFMGKNSDLLCSGHGLSLWVCGMRLWLLVLNRTTLLGIPRASGLIQVLFLAHISVCCGWLLPSRDSVTSGFWALHWILCIYLPEEGGQKRMGAKGQYCRGRFTSRPGHHLACIPLTRAQWNVFIVWRHKEKVGNEDELWIQEKEMAYEHIALTLPCLWKRNWIMACHLYLKTLIVCRLDV